jgi:hypothetical protein
VSFNIVTLCIQCLYAEYHYAECNVLVTVLNGMLVSVVILNVVVQSVMALVSVIFLSSYVMII